MISLRTYLRTNRSNRLGESVIYFIVGEEWISTEVKVRPQYWDPVEGSIRKSHPKYYVIAPYYQQLRSRADQFIANLHTSGKSFIRKHFEQSVFTGQEADENPDFLGLIDEYCNTQDLSIGRIKHYKFLKPDITSIIKRPRLLDINYSFALKLQKYLREKPGGPNNQNTIMRKMRMLKALVHYAQKTKLLKEDPLVDVKLKETTGTKKHLTADELDDLEKLYKSGVLNWNCQETLKYFLFSCYTGLRFSDITKLKYGDIKGGSVITTQEKTDKPVTVPLIPQARDLLSPGAVGLCFKTFTNQATNRFLKQIMSAADIDKKITYHCARHTFGTLSIFWGIPIDIVAELMGVNMKTVKVYAKIVDEVKAREMLKWEKKAG